VLRVLATHLLVDIVVVLNVLVVDFHAFDLARIDEHLSDQLVFLFLLLCPLLVKSLLACELSYFARFLHLYLLQFFLFLLFFILHLLDPRVFSSLDSKVDEVVEFELIVGWVFYRLLILDERLTDAFENIVVRVLYVSAPQPFLHLLFLLN